MVQCAPAGYSSVIARPSGNGGQGGGFRSESEDCWIDKTGESLPWVLRQGEALEVMEKMWLNKWKSLGSVIN